MIESYFRPRDMTEAIDLLSRTDGQYIPLGGGTTVSQGLAERVNIVDLQSLGLDTLVQKGQFLQIGATAKLQSLADHAALQPGLREAILHEVNINLRQQATAAGALIAAGGRSTFATAMLALDASLTWLPGETVQEFGDWLAVKQVPAGGCLVASIQIPLNAALSFEKVSRSPDDLPILCIAAARWPSGRIRIALGGFGKVPILAFDSPESGGAEIAVQDALSRAEDDWATAEYRQSIGKKLIQRMLNKKDRP